MLVVLDNVDNVVEGDSVDDGGNVVVDNRRGEVVLTGNVAVFVDVDNVVLSMMHCVGRLSQLHGAKHV